MTLDESKTEDDIVSSEHGVTIVSEKKFAEYLEGAVIDYVVTPRGSGFQIKTANSGGCSSCGGSCG